jgi:glutamyl-tRNA reductase
MKLLVCGINHKTAALPLREKLSFDSSMLQEPLQELKYHLKLSEAAILSTCNRTEIYAQIHDHEPLYQWLGDKCQLHHAELMQSLYTYVNEDAVRHIIKVACGLDSMLVGEAQVLGQMKTAYQVAQKEGMLGSTLQRLFQYVFAVTKEVRGKTGIGASPVSIAYAAVTLAKRIFTDLKQSTVMLIGAGEMIELAARYFSDQKVKNIFVVNRTYARAELIAKKYDAKAVTLAHMPDFLAESDIIVSATASPLPVIGKGMIERTLKKRKHRPMCMVDLAIPRDIEPEIAKLDDVFLYDLDDLQTLISSNLENRQHSAKEATLLIELHVMHFMKWLRSLDSVSVIRRLREKVMTTRDQELSKALQMLAQGKSAEIVMQRLAHAITNKFLHEPTIALRQAAYDGQLEFIDSLQRLFELDKN